MFSSGDIMLMVYFIIMITLYYYVKRKNRQLTILVRFLYTFIQMNLIWFLNNECLHFSNILFGLFLLNAYINDTEQRTENDIEEEQKK